MPSNKSDVAEVRAALRAVGYTVLQVQPRVEGLSGSRPDVLAWASNADGELVPWAVVECKNKKLRQPELVLPALEGSQDLLGTFEHYAVVNGQWFKADRGLRVLKPVDGPTRPEHGSRGLVTDRSLATSLLLQRLWFEADRLRNSGVSADRYFPSGDVLTPPRDRGPGIELPDGVFMPVRADVLWRAKQDALTEFASRGRYREFSSPPVLAAAVTALVEKQLVGTVLDPFCGTGSFLWATLDRAAERGVAAEFLGYEFDAQLAELAADIGQDAPRHVRIEKGDSFLRDFAEADVVVTAPPVGLTLNDRHLLLDGSTTTRADAAAVDKCVRALKPGGRAVLHLAQSFTFERRHAAYRRYLADNFHVAALIGLPAGAMTGSGVRSLVIVIDRAEPGETMVAHLGEDWETQLGPDGPALNAVLEFINVGADSGVDPEADRPHTPGRP
ncbi:HsdM family class I SAM-dependent methyltransferase [Streptomyces chilikensis]|uniref:HsdM family class I SAM-dependent methyltransferase n=1 Tax=Streptomyces chilikensis TaxID=1194079 RepID=UPI000B1C28CE|nr:N-6 DNA methylase [Streptomyces chilikensis]